MGGHQLPIRRTRVTIFEPEKDRTCIACGTEHEECFPVYLGTGRMLDGLAHGKVEFFICGSCRHAFTFALSTAAEQFPHVGEDVVIPLEGGVMDKTQTGEDPESVGTTVPVDDDSNGS